MATDWKSTVDLGALRDASNGSKLALSCAFDFSATPEGRLFWNAARAARGIPMDARARLREMLAECTADADA